MQTAYIDTETLGLYGPAAILQYAFDDDEPTLYNPWLESAGKTRALIRRITRSRVVAHNLTFDWQKIHSLWAGLDDFADDEVPIHDIDRFARSEYIYRSATCLKPPAAVCTLLVCQKELGGSALAAKEIRVRKIPEPVAEQVCYMLNSLTDLPPILFARQKVKREPWSVGECDAGMGWKDIVLKFAPSNGLKEVATHVLGIQDTQKIGAEVLPPVMPDELGYCPYAYVLSQHPISVVNDMRLWPDLVREHVHFWNNDERAVKYALDDIHLLRKLDHYLSDKTEKGLATDFDSEIACQVASCRMAGFSIDRQRLRDERDASTKVVQSAQVNVDSPKQVRDFLASCLDPMEQEVVMHGCDKKVLKSIVKEFVTDQPEYCCEKGCSYCGGAGTIEPGPLPVAQRAQHILDIRKHKKRKQLYDKLAVAGAAYPSFRVIGAKSGRMSGADGLNYHGIDGSKEIREVFTLADDDWVVSGGDMNSQELAIAAAVMKDESLGDVLRNNKKLHAVFASAASGLPYDQIMANANNKGSVEATWYARGKVCAYSIMYGASAFNVSQTMECTMDEAQQYIDDFFNQFPHMAETRKLVKQRFTVLTSDENGRMHLRKPEHDYIESAFGFRRSFRTELDVMQMLSDCMASWAYFTEPVRRNGHPNAPMESRYQTQGILYDDMLERKVIRREKKGPQKIRHCVSSALYACIFSMQGKILRAAMNHLIQSAGRTCTLRVQKRIWDDLQPVGIKPFEVKLLSVHDEIGTVSPPENTDKITHAVQDEMRKLTDTIPLLSLDWATDVGSWHGVKAAVGQAEWDELDEDEREAAVLADEFLRCGWGA